MSKFDLKSLDSLGIRNGLIEEKHQIHYRNFENIFKNIKSLLKISNLLKNFNQKQIIVNEAIDFLVTEPDLSWRIDNKT